MNISTAIIKITFKIIIIYYFFQIRKNVSFLLKGVIHNEINL